MLMLQATALLLLTMMWTLSLSGAQNYDERVKESGIVWLDGGRTWALAFRITPGTQVPAFDDYMDHDRDDDQPWTRYFIPVDCLAPGSTCCDRHYRSSLLSNWKGSRVDKVRVSVWKGGKEKAYIVFNGTGSNFTNWFSLNRVEESSWTDLKTTSMSNYFSIAGHQRSNEVRRTFFINRKYGGCRRVTGWLEVQDTKADTCNWARLNPDEHLPVIRYSTTNSFTKWEAATVDEADALTISVSFLSNSLKC